MLGVYTGYFGVNDRFDLRKSQLIVLWGSNATWTSPGNPVNYLLHAKQAGAKFICIDPVYTDVAALTDAEWIPLNQTTNQALAHGVMSSAESRVGKEWGSMGRSRVWPVVEKKKKR